MSTPGGITWDGSHLQVIQSGQNTRINNRYIYLFAYETDGTYDA